jgi:predicted enzyme related to lactoylglutathione lyase
MNRIVWFDIPVLDLARATHFYSQVLAVAFSEEYPGVAVMQHASGDIAGCLFKSEEQRPSADGIMVYFNVNGRMDEAVAQVTACAGRVVQAPHAIGEFGQRAVVLDSEGNRIVLHAQN